MIRSAWPRQWMVFAAATAFLVSISHANDTAVIGLSQEPPSTGPYVKTDHGYMVSYTATIPATDVTFEMIPIAGGTLTLGSPETESGRQATEGPQRKLTISPFWIGKYELTWDEYRAYMRLYEIFKDFEGRQLRLVNQNNLVDAITAPTPLYEPDFTFELGDQGRQPAVTMSQYAAKQYTKWLSAVSGQFYRLPSEAEWEYACRAGTSTRFSFGDDESQLEEYAWYAANADESYHEVGKKKPNAWGLYDMHGNVAEICLDQYDEKAYRSLADNSPAMPDGIRWGNKAFSHVIRGGAWDYDADELRSAARGKTQDWREEDPNLPRSPWWFTDSPARCVGMRLVRPLAEPVVSERQRFWDADAETIKDAVENRIATGRGVYGLVDPSLPDAIRDLKKK